jgi:hypothetical protein
LIEYRSGLISLLSLDARRAFTGPYFDAVSKALTAQSLLIEGADHGLEFPGDVRSTVEAMSDLLEATLAFARDEA